MREAITMFGGGAIGAVSAIAFIGAGDGGAIAFTLAYPQFAAIGGAIGAIAGGAFALTARDMLTAKRGG